MHFNRTRPAMLKANTLSVVKISGLHGVQVFSFKVSKTGRYIGYVFRQKANIFQILIFNVFYCLIMIINSKTSKERLKSEVYETSTDPCHL